MTQPEKPGNKSDEASFWAKIQKVKPSTLKEWSEVTKNALTALGILIGGAWVLYTFHALKQTEIAEASISHNQSRLMLDIEAECETNKMGTFVFADVTVNNIGTKPVHISHRWDKAYKTRDSMTSDRRKKESKGIYRPPLAVYRVGFSDNGEIERPKGSVVYNSSIFGHPVTVPSAETVYVNGDAKSISATVTWDLLRVGESRRIPFVVRVSEPGIYLVAYRIYVGMSEEEQEIYEAYTDSTKSAAAWSARTYVVVENVDQGAQYPNTSVAVLADENKSTPKHSEEPEEGEEEE